MTPYADFLYFGASLYVILPTLATGWIKRFSRFWIVLATAVMLVLQYWVVQKVNPSSSVIVLDLVVGYTCYQGIIAFVFLKYHAKIHHNTFLVGVIGLSLLPLVASRYAPFVSQWNGLWFVGISYLTFRSLDVLLGIQDGLITRLSAIKYGVYLLFFPTISSGPIDRYRRFEQDWTHDRSPSEFLSDVDGAVHRIFIGFLYKFILAALIKQYWLDPVASGSQFSQVLSYMYAYSFYLFFDFAGYSNFAIGFSYLFGIHTPENFNRPFLARNIRDFWNRWHISLSTWFRDHIYNRFVFAAIKGHWFKNPRVPSYIGFFITMVIMGLWHGTALHYLIYGIYHGSLLAGYDWFSRWNKQHSLIQGSPLFLQGLSIFITFNVVCFGLLIFSGRLG